MPVERTPPPPWMPTVVTGAAVFILAAPYELLLGGSPLGTFSRLLITALVAVAVGMSRLAPGLAVALCWAAVAVQAAGGERLCVALIATVVVAYNAARWGDRTALWVSGVSVPLGAVVTVLLVLVRGLGLPWLPVSVITRPLYSLSLDYYTVIGALAVLVFAALEVPWLAGLVLRARAAADRSRTLQQAAEQTLVVTESARRHAQEVAELRAAQTALTRDVHDVVGHSLAVILAQAESAAYLPEDDVEGVRRTLAAIAGSARQSLRDVRQVLTSTLEAADAGAVGDVEQLVEGVRATGAEVESVVVGEPRPLHPALDTLVFRVVQELLTNALKHGRRDAPVVVTRSWDAETVTVTVDNAVPDGAVVGTGLGLEGVRTRVEGVGGRFEARPDGGAEGDRWHAFAVVPVPVARP